jgi:sugar lactone lactonase YvrE
MFALYPDVCFPPRRPDNAAVQAAVGQHCRFAAPGAPAANSFQGRQANRPNDVVVRSDGCIYFTDPWTNPAPQDSVLAIFWNLSGDSLIPLSFSSGIGGRFVFPRARDSSIS